MSELIIKKAALEIVANHIGVKGDKVCLIDVGKTYGEIYALPTIEERKTGEWIRKISVVDCATFVGDECSQCGYFKSMGQANFCPNCGADMRGGGQDE